VILRLNAMIISVCQGSNVMRHFARKKKNYPFPTSPGGFLFLRGCVGVV